MSVSVPSRGDWGVLLDGDVVNLFQVMFPYPPEVTGGSYRLEYYSYREQTDMFPPPLEVTGGSYLSCCCSYTR